MDSKNSYLNASAPSSRDCEADSKCKQQPATEMFVDNDITSLIGARTSTRQTSVLKSSNRNKRGKTHTDSKPEGYRLRAIRSKGIPDPNTCVVM